MNSPTTTIPRRTYRPFVPSNCYQVYLYLRNASFNLSYIELGVNTKCRYIVQPVEYSNMILLVVNTDDGCEQTMMPRLTITPEEIIYENNSLVCQKALTTLGRKKPQSCIRSHSRESEIKDLCGLASNMAPNVYLFFLSSMIYILVQRVVFG